LPSRTLRPAPGTEVAAVDSEDEGTPEADAATSGRPIRCWWKCGWGVGSRLMSRKGRISKGIPCASIVSLRPPCPSSCAFSPRAFSGCRFVTRTIPLAAFPWWWVPTSTRQTPSATSGRVRRPHTASTATAHNGARCHYAFTRGTPWHTRERTRQRGSSAGAGAWAWSE